MREQASDALLARLDRLEHENRRLKIGGLAVVSMLGAVLLMGQAAAPTVSEEVRTRALMIIDETGTQRALLSASEDGVSLSLADGAGTSRVVLGSFREGASLALRDTKGRPRARLGALGVAEVPELDLFSQANEVQASLRADLAGSDLRLGVPGDPFTAELIAIAGFGPRLRLGTVGGPGAFIDGNPDAPELWLRDASARVHARLKLDREGPSLTLLDAEGARATLGATEIDPEAPAKAPAPSAASLVMRNKDTGVIWRAP